MTVSERYYKFIERCVFCQSQTRNTPNGISAMLSYSNSVDEHTHTIERAVKNTGDILSELLDIAEHVIKGSKWA